MTSSLLVLVVVLQLFLRVVSHGCPFNGDVYPYGDTLEDLCAPMICDEQIGGWNWTGIINPECEKCIAFCDPHVVTFDMKPINRNYKSYSYQGCGNYVMTQPGFSPKPNYGVFAAFKEYCGRDVSCVSNVTFKQDDISIMAESPHAKSVVKVKVNENHYIVPGLPTFVPWGGYDKVMGWRNTHFDNAYHWGPPDSVCVFFQGTKGLLIAFCGNEWANTLYIWAMPKLNNKVNGMCGTITDNIKDDYITRDRTQLTYHAAAPHILPAALQLWADSWLVLKNGDSGCPYKGRRSIQDNNTTCIDNDTHQANCNDTILRLGSGLTEYERNELIDDCTFDLCHVYNSTGYLQGAVAATVNLATYIKSITIKEVPTTLKPTTTGSPEDRFVLQILQKVN